MKRDLRALARGEHDVLIIGGGIYGAAMARDAALRGLGTALIEREDFGAATSWNSLKTVHGGFRDLQRANLRRVLESISERRRLLRLAPHLIRPLRFVLPTFGWGLRSRWALGGALGLYELLGVRRNRGVLPERWIPRGRVLSVRELGRLARDLDLTGITGAATWWDAQMHSSERVLLGFVAAAAQAGACVANHVEAVSWLRVGDRIRGLRVRDGLERNEFDVRARWVVNCAGPEAWNLLGKPGGLFHPTPPMSRAANLVLRRPLFDDLAMGLRVVGASSESAEQVLFIAPWRGRSLLGTLHLCAGDAPRTQVSADEIRRLLEAVNGAYPAARLTPDDVTLVHVGIQPVTAWKRNGAKVILPHSAIFLDHGKGDGTRGLLTVVGVKFTDAAGVASRVANLLCTRLGRGRPAFPGAGPPLPGGDFDNLASLAQAAARECPPTVPRTSLGHLVATYGTHATALLELCRSSPALGRPVTPGSPVIAAEVVHAVRREMAITLADVVLRRTELGARGDADEDAIRTCGRLAAQELGWETDRFEREMAAVREAVSFRQARGL